MVLNSMMVFWFIKKYFIKIKFDLINLKSETVDGKKCKSTINCDGPEKQTHLIKDPNTGELWLTAVRELVGDRLVQVISLIFFKNLKKCIIKSIFGFLDSKY